MVSRIRLGLALTAAGLAVAVIGARLVQLQLVEGADYFELSRQNRLRKLPVRAPRGCIYDRNGQLLAGNRAGFAFAWMLPSAEEVPVEAADRVAAYLGITREELRRAVEENREFPYEPAVVREDLGTIEVQAFEEVRANYPELAVISRPYRYYPRGATAAHLLGYVGEINRKRLKRLKKEGYKLGDTVGLAGVEDSFEMQLRGRDGYEAVAVNALEKKLGLEWPEETEPPRAGLDLHLTIDVRLQEMAEAMLAGKRGAIVVMDPHTGDVWAMASSPGYDPNSFVGGIAAADWAALATAADHPLLNRAVQCSYPPGSTFKIVAATAGLEEGLITPTQRMPVPCGGAYRYGTHVFHCWNPAGHGYLDVAGGLKNSCNVFFFQLGQIVGLDNLTKYARLYGYGRPTGVALANENSGLIPSRRRLERRWGRRWPKGEVLNNAIGQGQVLLTPIQELVAFSAFANGGRLLTPRLANYCSGPDGAVVEAYPPHVHGRFQLKAETRRTVLRGLIGVVNRYGANDHFLAGKTGSAENPFGPTHAWFTGFAPAYAPRVAVCILVENGGYGESYIKWAKELVAFSRTEIIGEKGWPQPPAGVTPQALEAYVPGGGKEGGTP